MSFEWDIVARLLVAAGLGALVGFEREAADQPAGLRTHLALSLGAALFGVVSTVGFLEYEAVRETTNIQIDVTRVASLVASGIGFIGAGLIFRQGSTVHNLTTAASLWVTAAIGLSCGVGNFAPAVATTVIVIVGLVALRVPRSWIRHFVRPDRETVRFVLRPGTPEGSLLNALQAIDRVYVDDIALEKENGAYIVVVSVHGDRGVDVRPLLSVLARLDEVETMQVASAMWE